MIERRSFITGLISLVAAPAIVRAGSLMPVRLIDIDAPYGRFSDLLEAQRVLNERSMLVIRCR